MTNARIISTLISDHIFVVARRGFVTAAHGGVTGGVRASGIMTVKKGGEESKKSIPWVPDPVTGYYRPEGQTKQVDAAELREQLVKQKNRRDN